VQESEARVIAALREALESGLLKSGAQKANKGAAGADAGRFGGK